MIRTTATSLIKCDECGQYEPQCSICGEFFRDNQKIYCDDVKYDPKKTGKHYCTKCEK